MPVPLPYHTSATRRALEAPSAIGAGQRDAEVAESTWPRPGTAPGTTRIVVHGPQSYDLTRDLFGWLTDEPGLHGRVHIIEEVAPRYALGTGEIVLEVVLGPGGAVTALVTVAITWLRSRKVSISISASDGERHRTVAITATSQLGATDIRELAAQLSEMLADEHTDENARECDGARHDAA